MPHILFVPASVEHVMALIFGPPLLANDCTVTSTDSFPSLNQLFVFRCAPIARHLDDTRICDDDRGFGLTGRGSHGLDQFDDIETLDDLTCVSQQEIVRDRNVRLGGE